MGLYSSIYMSIYVCVHVCVWYDTISLKILTLHILDLYSICSINPADFRFQLILLPFFYSTDMTLSSFLPVHWYCNISYLNKSFVEIQAVSWAPLMSLEMWWGAESL